VFNNTAEAGNSYSRYAGLYICSACGVREAVEGFFWRAWCPPDKIDKHHQQ
jgi:hypothetical protein